MNNNFMARLACNYVCLFGLQWIRGYFNNECYYWRKVEPPLF